MVLSFLDDRCRRCIGERLTTGQLFGRQCRRTHGALALLDAVDRPSGVLRSADWQGPTLLEKGEFFPFELGAVPKQRGLVCVLLCDATESGLLGGSGLVRGRYRFRVQSRLATLELADRDHLVAVGQLLRLDRRRRAVYGGDVFPPGRTPAEDELRCVIGGNDLHHGDECCQRPCRRHDERHKRTEGISQLREDVQRREEAIDGLHHPRQWCPDETDGLDARLEAAEKRRADGDDQLDDLLHVGHERLAHGRQKKLPAQADLALHGEEVLVTGGILLAPREAGLGDDLVVVLDILGAGVEPLAHGLPATPEHRLRGEVPRGGVRRLGDGVADFGQKLAHGLVLAGRVLQRDAQHLHGLGLFARSLSRHLDVLAEHAEHLGGRLDIGTRHLELAVDFERRARLEARDTRHLLQGLGEVLVDVVGLDADGDKAGNGGGGDANGRVGTTAGGVEPTEGAGQRGNSVGEVAAGECAQRLFEVAEATPDAGDADGLERLSRLRHGMVDFFQVFGHVLGGLAERLVVPEEDGPLDIGVAMPPDHYFAPWNSAATLAATLNCLTVKSSTSSLFQPP